MTSNDLLTELRQNLNNPDFEYRDVQQNAIEASFSHNHGLFDMTCGIGKTLIQASIIRNAVEECKNNDKQFIGLFVCHRLMLEDQVMNEYERFFKFSELGVKLVKLNSEGDNSLKAIAKNKMQTAMKNEHVLYMTTTASINDYIKDNTTANKDGILEAGIHIFKPVSLYVHDEAHKEYNARIVEQILFSSKNSKAYFFTATPGQYLTDNDDLPTIATCTYADAVKAGYIVKPVLHFVKNETVKLTANDEGNAVIKAFKHMKQYRTDTPSLITFHDSIDAVRNTAQVLIDYKSKHPRFNAHVYEIVSDKMLDGKWLAGLRLNGQRTNADDKLYTKSEILKILREDTNPKIIMNAFMLTEGIDLPEINGVFILCEKSDASLYQAISRGCRKTASKTDFYLYTTIADGIGTRTEKFIEDLANDVGGHTNFDFGGIIEDVNNGSTDDVVDEDNDFTVNNTIACQQYTAVTVTISKQKTAFDKLAELKSAAGQFKIKRNAAKNSVKSLVSLFFNETGKHDSEFDTTYLTVNELLAYVSK